MFASSVAQYLLIRRSVALKTPSQFTNLAMFIIPLALFIVMAKVTNTGLTVTWYQFFVFVILSIFFSYLGNAISLKSIEYAPNPGYSLVLSKSYVVFTTLAALFLFHSTLTTRSSLAILLIVGCSALISIDKRGTKQASHVRSSWLPLAIGAFFCWGMLSITSKYLLDIGVNTLTRLIYSMFMVTLLIVGEMIWKKKHQRVNGGRQWLIFWKDNSLRDFVKKEAKQS